MVVWRWKRRGRFGWVEEGMRDKRRISSGASRVVYWNEVDSAILLVIGSWGEEWRRGRNGNVVPRRPTSLFARGILFLAM